MEVEVFVDDAYCPATIEKLTNGQWAKGTVLVAFRDDSGAVRCRDRVKQEQVRLPPSDNFGNHKYSIDDIVEINVTGLTYENTSCWYRGKIYKIWENKFHILCLDVYLDRAVGKSMIRPGGIVYSKISDTRFEHDQIVLPEDLRVFFDSSDLPIARFVKQFRGLHLEFSDDHTILMYALTREILKQAKVAILQFLEKHRLAAFSKSLNVNPQTEHFIEEFEIDPGLARFVVFCTDDVGIRLIKTARNIRGIVNIILPRKDEGKFKIIAKTKDAARNARGILEFDSKEVQVPTELVDRVIGDNGDKLKCSIGKPRIIKVEVLGNVDEFTIVKLTGARNTLSIAINRLPRLIKQSRKKLKNEMSKGSDKGNPNMKSRENGKATETSKTQNNADTIPESVPEENERVENRTELERNAEYWRKMYEEAVRDAEALWEEKNDIEKKYKELLMVVGQATVSGNEQSSRG